VEGGAVSVSGAKGYAPSCDYKRSAPSCQGGTCSACCRRQHSSTPYVGMRRGLSSGSLMFGSTLMVWSQSCPVGLGLFDLPTTNLADRSGVQPREASDKQDIGLPLSRADGWLVVYRACE
ncbi:unnamed protein product, partial [Boreogadus saida]